MPFFACTVKEHVSVVKIAITENFLDKVGNKFETPKCQFDDLDDVSFTVACETESHANGSVFETTLKVQVHSSGGSSLQVTCFVDDIDAGLCNSRQYFHKADIKPFCENGKFTLTVTVKHQSDISVKTVAASYIQLQTHEIIGNTKYLSDAKIVVGEKEIKVHRSFLSAISPVFKSMLTHNTEGIITIKDMDAAVVKDSLKILYGHKVQLKTIPQAIGMLHFFKKYYTKGVIDHVESWIADYLNLVDFGAVIKHAWEHSNEKLQKRCREFFYENPRFVFTKEYRELPSDVMKSLSERDV